MILKRVVIILISIFLLSGAFALGTTYSSGKPTVPVLPPDARLVKLSSFYSKMAKIIWGKKAGRCDVNIIMLVDKYVESFNANDTSGLKLRTETLLAVMVVESGFNASIISDKGAIGLMQVMPSTAVGINKSIRKEDLFDEETNIMIGIFELGRLLRIYGDLEIALLAYNRGPGKINKLLSAAQPIRNGYSCKVFLYEIKV